MGTARSKASVRKALDALGPWCHEIDIVEGVSTREWHERNPESDVPFVDPKVTVVGKTLPHLFKRDLESRSVLDCGCNAGGYLFLARELGAGRCFGFDVRQHWIDQARFIAECRQYDDMAFEALDLYDLELESFDVTFFNGLFYHLPDPMRGLKLAADLTREVMFVDTSARAGMPDGYLAVENESTELLVSGVYGLNWLPTGPDVMERIFAWAGFTEWIVAGYRPLSEGVNRLVMVASKVPGQLAHIPDRRTQNRL